MSFRTSKSPTLLTLALAPIFLFHGSPAQAGFNSSQPVQRQSYQNIKLYFGTLKSAEKKDQSISNVDLEVERIDYLTKKGWYSLSDAKKMNVKLSAEVDDDDDDDGEFMNLRDAEGFAQIRIVLNKNKYSRIRNYRGHECVIRERAISIQFNEALKLQDKENNKIKVFLDLQQSFFFQDRNRYCIFKPKFKIITVGHDKACVDFENKKRYFGYHSEHGHHSQCGHHFGHNIFKTIPHWFKHLHLKLHHGHHHHHRHWNFDEYDQVRGKVCQNHKEIVIKPVPKPPVPPVTPPVQPQNPGGQPPQDPGSSGSSNNNGNNGSSNTGSNNSGSGSTGSGSTNSGGSSNTTSPGTTTPSVPVDSNPSAGGSISGNSGNPSTEPSGNISEGGNTGSNSGNTSGSGSGQTGPTDSGSTGSTSPALPSVPPVDNNTGSSSGGSTTPAVPPSLPNDGTIQGEPSSNGSEYSSSSGSTGSSGSGTIGSGSNETGSTGNGSRSTGANQTPVPVPAPVPAPVPVPAPAPLMVNDFKVLEVFLAGVSLTWTTDVASDSQVIVTNLSTGVISSTSVDSAQVTSHQFVVEGLEPGVTYQLQAVSTSGDRRGVSAVIVFNKE